MTPPDLAARLILEAIEKDRYSVHVGPGSKMMDFLSRFNPRRAAGFIQQQMLSFLPV